MNSSFRQALLFVAALLASFVGIGARAATISGPTSDTTGTFTLTWPNGYHLVLSDVPYTVKYDAGTANSYTFTSLGSGTYKFALFYCTGGTPPEYIPDCSTDAASYKTVTVTRDTEPALDNTTVQAGSTSFAAGVSRRGSASVSVPLRILPVFNSAGTSLALTYDSARAFDRTDNFATQDVLGYGWALSGISYIYRCRVGTTGMPDFTASDRLCMDGEPLVAVSGAYWSANTEYRTERQSFIKIIQKTTGFFEVHYPDGRVGMFDTYVAGSGSGGFFSPPDPNGAFIWALHTVTATTGDVWTATYQIFDGYTEIRPLMVTYADAKIEFKYGPRTDYLPVQGGTSANLPFPFGLRRLGLLNKIVISETISGVQRPIREYRLDSNADTGGLARHELHDQIGHGAFGASVEEAGDVRMVERRQDLAFEAEARLGGGADGRQRRQLDGDTAGELVVADALIDDTHAAAADLAHHPVVAEARGQG